MQRSMDQMQANVSEANIKLTHTEKVEERLVQLEKIFLLIDFQKLEQAVEKRMALLSEDIVDDGVLPARKTTTESGDESKVGIKIPSTLVEKKQGEPMQFDMSIGDEVEAEEDKTEKMELSVGTTDFIKKWLKGTKAAAAEIEEDENEKMGVPKFPKIPRFQIRCEDDQSQWARKGTTDDSMKSKTKKAWKIEDGENMVESEYEVVPISWDMQERKHAVMTELKSQGDGYAVRRQRETSTTEG